MSEPHGVGTRPHPVNAVVGCPLCHGDGGRILSRTPSFRVVWPDEPGHPGLLRVIWNQHVAEMSDLDEVDRACFMDGVWRVEAVTRSVLVPDKVNLASLGNMVPHLHWHVIPRWQTDPQFPASIWSPAQAGREDAASLVQQRVRARLDVLFEAIGEAFASG